MEQENKKSIKKSLEECEARIKNLSKESHILKIDREHKENLEALKNITWDIDNDFSEDHLPMKEYNHGKNKLSRWCILDGNDNVPINYQFLNIETCINIINYTLHM